MSRPFQLISNARTPWPFVLNRQSGQARGLVAWHVFGAGHPYGHEVITNRAPTTGTESELAVSGTDFGLVQQTTGDTGRISWPFLAQNEPTDLQSVDFTIAAWIRTTDSSGTIASTVNNGSPWGGWSFSIGLGGSAGKLTFWNGTVWAASGTLRVDDGTWRHLVVAYDSSASTLTLYVDAVQDHNVTSYGAPSANQSSVGFRLLGWEASTDANHNLRAYCADLRIYHHRLSVEEIYALWHPQTRWDLYQQPSPKIWIEGPPAGAGHNITPTAGDLTVSTTAPARVQAHLRAPTTGDLTLSPTAPARSVSITITPTTGDLALSPTTVGRVQNHARSAITGDLTLSPTAPSRLQAHLRTATAGDLTLDATAPSVSVTGDIQPATGQLTLSTTAPARVQAHLRTATAGDLALSTTAPAVTSEKAIQPTTGQLTLSSTAPAVSRAYLRTATTGTLTLSTVAPSLARAYTRTPTRADLTLTGFAPAVSGISLTALESETWDVPYQSRAWTVDYDETGL